MASIADHHLTAESVYPPIMSQPEAITDVQGSGFGGSWILLVFGALAFFLFKQIFLKRNKATSEGVEPDQKGITGDDRNIVERMEVDEKNCAVLFASQTGTAETYAGRLAKEARSRYGLSTLVAPLEDYDLQNLDQLGSDKLVFFVMATYGEGEPPDNAIEFFNFLTGNDVDSSKGKSLSNLQYVAFGLGNKTYEHYNAMVRRVVKALDDLGANKLAEAGEADDAAGTTEEDFLAWKESMWPVVAEKMDLRESEMNASYEPSYQISENNDLNADSPSVFLGEANQGHLTGHVETQYGPHNPCIVPVNSSKELIVTKQIDRRCIHLDVDISSTGMSYETGDHVAVWPSNASDEVERILQVLGLAEKRYRAINIETVDPSAKIPFPQPTVYDAVFRHYLEICAPVSRQLASDIIPFAPSDGIKKKLAALTKDKDLFHKETHYSNLSRLLIRLSDGQAWPNIPVSLIIEALPKLQARFYSISSSSLTQPTDVSITVAVKSEVMTTRKEGDPFCGVASNFLLDVHRARNGEKAKRYDVLGPRQWCNGHRIPIHIRRSSFRLPTDISKPVVMIGPGTGVAPFRAFVQERAHMAMSGHSVGPMLLFFGCRRSDEDFLYKNEWKQYADALGDKFTMITAFSRDTTEKSYVQHKKKDHAKEVYGFLDRDGFVYVCGDASHMAKEVSHVLGEVMAEGRQVDLEVAEELIKSMRESHRYMEDTWA